MSETKKSMNPPDLSLYEHNRSQFSLEELAKYAGQHIAFSADGTCILASGSSMDEVEQKLEAAGIDPSQVVGSYVSPDDVVLLL